MNKTDQSKIKRRFNYSKVTEEKIFYVYVLKNPINNKIFYVGFGHDKRAYVHWKIFLRTIRKIENGELHLKIKTFKFQEFYKIYKEGLEPIVKIVRRDMELFEGLAFETKLIAKFGKRIDKTGYLVNIVDNALESPVIYKEIREKVSTSLRKIFDGPRGDEVRKRMSDSRKKYFKTFPENKPFGEKNHMYGKEHSEETKDKIKDSCIEYFSSHSEVCEIISKKSKSNWIKWFKSGEAERIIKKRSMAKRQRVICFNKDLSILKIYNSYVEIQEMTGLHRTNISACTRRVSTHCGGLIWRKFNGDLLRKLIKRKMRGEQIKCVFITNKGTKTLKYYEEI